MVPSALLTGVFSSLKQKQKQKPLATRRKDEITPVIPRDTQGLIIL